jgi:hypothetical protein
MTCIRDYIYYSDVAALDYRTDDSLFWRTPLSVSTESLLDPDFGVTRDPDTNR